MNISNFEEFFVLNNFVCMHGHCLNCLKHFVIVIQDNFHFPVAVAMHIIICLLMLFVSVVLKLGLIRGHS